MPEPTPAPRSLTCPRCRMVTYNPTDIKEGYCAQCEDYTSGKTSIRAFEEAMVTGEIPAWRREALTALAIEEAVREVHKQATGG